MKLVEMLLNEAAVENEAKIYKKALDDLRYDPTILDDIKEMIKQANGKNLQPSLIMALVASESSFNPKAINYNSGGGSTDYGYFQLNSNWFNQHRSNVKKHIETGVKHLKWCLDTEKNNVNKALSRYNTGSGESNTGARYASYVLDNKRKIESKARSVRAAESITSGSAFNNRRNNVR